MKRVEKNKYNYYEVINKPKQQELNEYYAKKYYQNEQSTYSHYYSSEELTYINNRLQQKELVLRNFFGLGQLESLEGLSLLDIGCGEGYCLDYFSKLGLQVKGTDFSKYGCQTHNPEQLENVLIGDTIELIENLVAKSVFYDVVIMDNILEHVIDPGFLLKQVRRIMKDNALVIVEVPNDFSELQNYLLNTNQIASEFWIVTPDHLSYFNHEGLINLFEEFGFKKYQLYSDYPIDFNLLVDALNYVQNPSVGKDINQQRIKVENYLHDKSPEKLLAIYKILAEMRIGRNIVGYFAK